MTRFQGLTTIVTKVHKRKRQTTIDTISSQKRKQTTIDTIEHNRKNVFCQLSVK